MNLPVHGITSPDPSVVSVLKQHTKTKQEQQHFAWPNTHAARRNYARPPSDTSSPPSASALPNVTGFPSLPGDAHIVARHHALQKTLQWFLSPGGTSGPPGAIPVTPCYLYWHSIWLVFATLEHSRIDFTHVSSEFWLVSSPIPSQVSLLYLS